MKNSMIHSLSTSLVSELRDAKSFVTEGPIVEEKVLSSSLSIFVNTLQTLGYENDSIISVIHGAISFLKPEEKSLKEELKFQLNYL